MKSPLSDLQEWYATRCDGDWEHGFGISIGTLDNPGWSLDVNLEGTELEGARFAELKENYGEEQDWLICAVHDNHFTGHGGPLKLERMIQIFLEWARTVNVTTMAEQPATRSGA